MIQEALMNELKTAIPELTWSVDYYFADDYTGTVYSTSSGQPDRYDTEYRYPGYQVWIRSSDWDYAKLAAELTYKQLHKKSNFRVAVDYEKDGQVVLKKHYLVLFVMAASDPLRIGDNNGIMEYSVNFDVTLKEEK
ncbi:minor capsid protein [Oceanobacillus profundus]|uniref:minor capsid protein n=1 Tax=Oceanobacillus profundus TaxID=372463 RepID=UPI002041D5C7|nr:minor capsid protein [Oceanobacillus profundus]MCM3396487.1 minor capsid protein [Oceanobacillus profundus]